VNLCHQSILQLIRFPPLELDTKVKYRPKTRNNRVSKNNFMKTSKKQNKTKIDKGLGKEEGGQTNHFLPSP